MIVFSGLPRCMCSSFRDAASGLARRVRGSGDRAGCQYVGRLAGDGRNVVRAIRGFGAELAVVQLRVKAAAGKQLGVGSGGHQLALVQDEDLVGGQDGGQPVGDDQCSAAVQEQAQCPLDVMIGAAVEV